MAHLSLKTGTSQALSLEPVEDGALLAPTDKKAILLDQGNSRKEIKTGHTIQNSSGVNINDRDTLQFKGATITDDSTNNKTVVDVSGSITALAETSPATSTHAVGTYLTYNGTIYKVKSAIAIGDTLTVGTNIEVVTIPDGTIVFWEDGVSSASGQVQSDWNQTNTSAPDYIKNKPEISGGGSDTFTPDGSETWKAFLARIYSTLDTSKITINSKVAIGTWVFTMALKTTDPAYVFTQSMITDNLPCIRHLMMYGTSSFCQYHQYRNGTFTDYSLEIADEDITIYY